VTSPTPEIWTPNYEQWLCQGDLFLRAPLVLTQSDDDGAGHVEFVLAPALLASHGCALDKTNRRGVMQATEVTFLPLRQVAALEGNRQAIVRNNNVTPYDFLYVGNLGGDLGESYVNLNSASTFSLDYFAPQLRVFEGDPEGHLVATRHDDRMGTLALGQLSLFLDKWNVHWTRRMMSPEAPT
jgi:hypothetical protein